MIESIVAFNLDTDVPSKVSPESLVLPDPLTNMICRNMRHFLGIDLLAMNYRVSADRVIDAIAVQGLHYPVVVRFRHSTGTNIVEEVRDDYEWLHEHPDAIERAAKQLANLSARSVRPDWLKDCVYVAAGFSNAEIELARDSNMWGEPVRLIQVLRADDGHIVVHELDTSPRHSENVGRSLQSLGNSEALAASTGIPEDELRRWMSDEIRALLQAEFKEQLQGFDLVPAAQLEDPELLTAYDPLSHASSESREALRVLETLQSDIPRSTRFLHVLRASLGPNDERFKSTYPGKSTLRASYPELGYGCELVFGARRYDARVEWYIPRNFGNRDLLKALDDHWDRTANTGNTYLRADDDHAVRIYRLSTHKIGWNDLETLWPAVLDDLVDLMFILEESIEEFFLETFGYDPLAP